MTELENCANNDTIAARATPLGSGGVGIVRVSGSLVQKIAKAVLGVVPKVRYVRHGEFFDKDRKVIDHGLALYFKAPNSFTGEDVLELHGHGGEVVLDLILARALELGARLAKPGEFSERAFLNDKLDLVQAEAIADLIEARSKRAAYNAARSLCGEFSKLIFNLKESLIKLRLEIEADIDFPEEGLSLFDRLQKGEAIDALIDTIHSIRDAARQGVLLREGITIVISGKPNAGKSSLLNYFTGEDTAIVTDIPGTTRDVIRERIQIFGVPIHITDTAGLKKSDELVEQEGIRRAFKEMRTADYILYVIDAKTDNNRDPKELFLNSEIGLVIKDKKKLILVYNKIDLTGEEAKIDLRNDITSICLSVKTGEGLNLLKEHFKAVLNIDNIDEVGFSARRRHLEALERIDRRLRQAKKNWEENFYLELVAEELRAAQDILGEILGEFSSAALLRRIFDQFCIGK